MKRILIAIPCMEQVSADFAHSLAIVTSMPIEGASLSIEMQKGSLVYASRNEIAKHAVQLGYDYVMWFDSDMVFEANVIGKMYNHMKDGKKFVTGVYYRRAKPYTPVLFKDLELTADKSEWTDYNDYPENEMFKVGGCGFGCVMFDTEMLFSIAGRNEQWFDPKNGLGEDLAFCQRAREAGYELWCDPTIQCGHTGTLIVTKALYDSLKGENNEG